MGPVVARALRQRRGRPAAPHPGEDTLARTLRHVHERARPLFPDEPVS